MLLQPSIHDSPAQQTCILHDARTHLGTCCPTRRSKIASRVKITFEKSIDRTDQQGIVGAYLETPGNAVRFWKLGHRSRPSRLVGRRQWSPSFRHGFSVGPLSSSHFVVIQSTMATLGGLVAGNIAVLHSILVETRNHRCTNQYIAVPTYNLSWSTGIVWCIFLFCHAWLEVDSLICIVGCSLVGRLRMLRHGTRNIFHGLFSWTIPISPPVSLVLCVRSWERGWVWGVCS